MAGQGKRWWAAVPIGHLDEERYLALTLAARGVLADLYRVADREGRFHAGRRAMARALGLAEVSGADSAIVELVRFGFVEFYDAGEVEYGEIVGLAAMFSGGHWERRSASQIPPRTLDAEPLPTKADKLPTKADKVPTRVKTEKHNPPSGGKRARSRARTRGPQIEAPNEGRTLADKRAALAAMKPIAVAAGGGHA